MNDILKVCVCDRERQKEREKCLERSVSLHFSSRSLKVTWPAQSWHVKVFFFAFVLPAFLSSPIRPQALGSACLSAFSWKDIFYLENCCLRQITEEEKKMQGLGPRNFIMTSSLCQVLYRPGKPIVKHLCSWWTCRSSQRFPHGTLLSYSLCEQYRNSST